MAGHALGDVVYTIEQLPNVVRNIYCIGRNYRDHAVELGNAVPESPMVFGKPTHALTAAAGDLMLPAGRQNIHHEVEIVLVMGDAHRPGEPFANRVSGVALGLDLTDRDAQNRLKKAGQPWEFAKGFRHAAVMTDVYAVNDWDAMLHTPFRLIRNGQTVQEGVARDMLFHWQTLLDFIAEHFGLGAGDVVYTGTPAGVGPLEDGDELVLQFADATLGRCRVRRA
ncbi:fumarylacetoacetate hydrolase [Alicyclobacillus contaminans]|uniref:fumarylacetoacetate hydrolase family protein n=1 Tax=Alicyclobacillus contaminans TaxID=392016 RepID=UPI00041ADAAA|nr:fumarylacetoacetate hydrolase family protein [Alicyclobacillus contaminans]GMA51960.1 fumarylacetoacetate hydrolase [Alicyclobacillus contaminans]